MPNRSTTERAKRDLRQGKSPSTAAGEFVHEEIEHVRQGKHGARSPQQAVAIGLSKARRAGVPLPPPKKGKAKESTRTNARRAYNKGQAGGNGKPLAARLSSPQKSAQERVSPFGFTQCAVGANSQGSPRTEQRKQECCG